MYHLYVIRVKKRSQLINFLKRNKVETNIHYPKILPEVPAFKKLYGKNSCIEAKKNSKKILSLPIGEHLSSKQIIKISRLINKFYSE